MSDRKTSSTRASDADGEDSDTGALSGAEGSAENTPPGVDMPNPVEFKTPNILHDLVKKTVSFAY